MRSVFAVGGPHVGVDESTRRAIGQLNLEHPEVGRILAACGRLGLGAVSPAFKPDVCAHIGIPSKKVAIVTRKAMDQSFYELNYSAWKRHGWEMVAVTHRQTHMLTDEQLLAHLKAALQQLGKMR